VSAALAGDDRAPRSGWRRTAGDMAPLLLLALAIGVRVWNVWAYDLRHQHDVRVHIGYLRELAQGSLMPSYNAPWYYLATCLLALPVIVPCRLLGTSDETLLRLAVGFAGTLLFAAFMAGCLALGRALGLREADARWYAALVCAFPVVARTFNMVRPENLILVLTPWALVWLVRWAPEAAARPGQAIRRPLFRALAAAGALMMAQKVGGAALVATMPAFLAVRAAAMPARRRLGAALAFWTAATALALVLVGVQLLATGATPFRHDLAADPRFRSAPARFFVTLDPAQVWRQPLRDAHRGSMPAILLIDMYGDYWRAGIDQVTLGRSETARLGRARLGILAGTVFLGLWLASLGCLLTGRAGRVAARPDLSLTRAALYPLAASAAYLIAAALGAYVPEDGDIAKWEYVVWVFVFLPIPLIQVTAGLGGGAAASARAGLWGLAVVGLAQSVVASAF
jgi:hypothetical protein